MAVDSVKSAASSAGQAVKSAAAGQKPATQTTTTPPPASPTDRYTPRSVEDEPGLSSTYKSALAGWGDPQPQADRTTNTSSPTTTTYKEGGEKPVTVTQQQNGSTTTVDENGARTTYTPRPGGGYSLQTESTDKTNGHQNTKTTTYDPNGTRTEEVTEYDPATGEYVTTRTVVSESDNVPPELAQAMKDQPGTKPKGAHGPVTTTTTQTTRGNRNSGTSEVAEASTTYSQAVQANPPLKEPSSGTYSYTSGQTRNDKGQLVNYTQTEFEQTGINASYGTPETHTDKVIRVEGQPATRQFGRDLPQANASQAAQYLQIPSGGKTPNSFTNKTMNEIFPDDNSKAHLQYQSNYVMGPNGEWVSTGDQAVVGTNLEDPSRPGVRLSYQHTADPQKPNNTNAGERIYEASVTSYATHPETGVSGVRVRTQAGSPGRPGTYMTDNSRFHDGSFILSSQLHDGDKVVSSTYQDGSWVNDQGIIDGISNPELREAALNNNANFRVRTSITEGDPPKTQAQTVYTNPDTGAEVGQSGNFGFFNDPNNAGNNYIVAGGQQLRNVNGQMVDANGNPVDLNHPDHKATREALNGALEYGSAFQKHVMPLLLSDETMKAVGPAVGLGLEAPLKIGIKGSMAGISLLSGEGVDGAADLAGVFSTLGLGESLADTKLTNILSVAAGPGIDFFSAGLDLYKGVTEQSGLDLMSGALGVGSGALGVYGSYLTAAGVAAPLAPLAGGLALASVFLIPMKHEEAKTAVPDWELDPPSGYPATPNFPQPVAPMAPNEPT